jgi:hypothetical protein
VKKETLTDKGNSLHSKYALEVSRETLPIIRLSISTPG